MRRLQTFRIFTNDRGTTRGIPMYSALKDVQAVSSEAARRQCPPQFDEPNYAPSVAIRWPASAQSVKERDWLRKHVGEPLYWTIMFVESQYSSREPERE
jgi:hypothetical protein